LKPNTTILTGSVINNCTVESFTYIGKDCIIQNAKIGGFSSIANDVFIGLGKHPIDNFSTSPLFYRKQNPFNIGFLFENIDFKEYENITIGNDVWIGARAIILDGVIIETGAIIAANSVVTKNVPAYAIVGGSPAKIIKYRFSAEKIAKLLKSEWWLKNIDKIDLKVLNQD
jgi:acetyltransferase-like isoleucine patch superfamily enzyme